MSSPTTSEASTCPRCNARASGRFCASCGAPLQGVSCGACGSTLVAGARFCHRCGTAVGATVPKQAEPRWLATALPWGVAGIALIALIALVATQRFKAPPAEAGTVAGPGFSPDDVRRAPDISSMTPRERADRLYDRVMRLSTEGKTDSAQFFARMAVDAYGSLPDLDLDARYDLGRIAEVAGALPVAAAQADTILRRAPTHLLGLILAASVAERSGDAARAAEMRRRLLASADAERQKGLPEYQRHQGEIDGALAAARQ